MSRRAPQGYIDRVIVGALQSCINDHGAITKNYTASAAKRVRAALRGEGFFKEGEKVIEYRCSDCRRPYLPHGYFDEIEDETVQVTEADHGIEP